MYPLPFYPSMMPMHGFPPSQHGSPYHTPALAPATAPAPAVLPASSVDNTGLGHARSSPPPFDPDAFTLEQWCAHYRFSPQVCVGLEQLEIAPGDMGLDHITKQQWSGTGIATHVAEQVVSYMKEYRCAQKDKGHT
jgi:hypothetical protein